jgi:Domain of Unknown Function (DUF1080)
LKLRHFIWILAPLAVAAFAPGARAADSDFNGRWDITVHKTPADRAWWLEVNGAGSAALRGAFVGMPGGSLDTLPDPKIENGVLKWTWVPRRNPNAPANPNAPVAKPQEYSFRLVNGVLEGEMTTGSGEPLKVTGHRAPVAKDHDDGTWVKGKTITLFNGKDLAGWEGLKSPDAKGWTVVDGILTSTGHADDLLTKQKFWNFEIHVEYNIAEKSNSGLGLRGRYEVQIMDDFGRPPGFHNTGTLYTRIVPAENYGLPAGQWQTLDVRLVGVEVTGHLNGHLLYDKGVIEGLTGIAYDPNEAEAGAIELQGDHGAVQFRNLVITPLVQKK